MNAIAFQSMVKANCIEIPTEYRDFVDSSVFVTVMNLPVGTVHPLRKALSLDDFAPANIDTTGWKFNREEANER
jgi:hypothetical protein